MVQPPRPYVGQPEDEARALMERYEVIRGTYLEPWMEFLQVVASYMTTHDKRTITRPEIEQLVSSGWTLAKQIEIYANFLLPAFANPRQSLKKKL